MTLGGANTYTGTTTINDGVLRITGSISIQQLGHRGRAGHLDVQGVASSVGGITGAGMTKVGDGTFPTTLTTSHIRQSSLNIGTSSKVTTHLGSTTSVLNTLTLAGTPSARPRHSISPMANWFLTIRRPDPTLRRRATADHLRPRRQRPGQALERTGHHQQQGAKRRAHQSQLDLGRVCGQRRFALGRL